MLNRLAFVDTQIDAPTELLREWNDIRKILGGNLLRVWAAVDAGKAIL